jgi:hypothetical protein
MHWMGEPLVSFDTVADIISATKTSRELPRRQCRTRDGARRVRLVQHLNNQCYFAAIS